MAPRDFWIPILALVTLSACTSSASANLDGEEEILVLEVAPHTVSCVGEMAGRCIQVRGPGEEEWRIFYHTIDGFEHEEGFQYRLRVARREVPNPPADGSAYAYRLIEVLSMEFVGSMPARSRTGDVRDGGGRPHAPPSRPA